MQMTVNGQQIITDDTRCTQITKNRDSIRGYTAIITFDAYKILTEYEKECLGDYIEHLLDQKEGKDE